MSQKKKSGTGVLGLGPSAQSPEPSPHAASAAGDRPDDVQEEETWFFDLIEQEEGFIKDHFLLSPEEKEEIVQKILERLQQG